MSDTSVSKTNRVLQILLLALKGESISACNLADRFHVSTRSLSRDISDVQNFISENQEILGYAQLEYSYQSNRYVMDAEHLFTNRELLAITKVLLASRAFQKDEMLEIIEKLKKNTTPADKAKLEKLVKKEMLHYNAINIDC
jgi:predicted DNA-binding transcriptional regulator YafY